MTRRLRQRRAAAQRGGAIENSAAAGPLKEWLLKVFEEYRKLNNSTPRQFNFSSLSIPEFDSTENYPMPQRFYQRPTDKVWVMDFEPPQGANPEAYYLHGNFGKHVNYRIRSLSTTPPRDRVADLNSVEFQAGITENLKTQPESVMLLLEIERLLRAILRESIVDSEVVADGKVKEPYTSIVGDITTLNNDYSYPLLIWAVGLSVDVPIDTKSDEEDLIPVLAPPTQEEPALPGGSTT